MNSLLQKSKMAVVALLFAALITQSGCGRAGFLAARILVTAAVVATVLAVHDSHYHSHHCGHEYVIVEERPVYRYEGRWEYYDDHEGQWYQYEELPHHHR